MKKPFVYILVICLLIVCAGCGNKAENPDDLSSIVVLPDEITAQTVNGYKKTESEPGSSQIVVSFPKFNPTVEGHTTPQSATYYGNKNSKKFHKADCTSVPSIKQSNLTVFHSRSDAVDAGYAPCGKCNP